MCAFPLDSSTAYFRAEQPEIVPSRPSPSRYAASGDERLAVLGDALLERDWAAVDYFERTYERAA